MRRSVLMLITLSSLVSCEKKLPSEPATPTEEPKKEELRKEESKKEESKKEEPKKEEPKVELKVACGTSGCKVEERLTAEAIEKVKKEGKLAENALVLSKIGASDLGLLARIKDDLKRLELDGMEDENLDALKPLSALEELKIYTKTSTKPVDASGLADKPKLKKLYIFATKLKDISSLKSSPDLEELGLEGTGVEEISVLKELKKLKKLIVPGTAKDLSALGELTELTFVGLHYSVATDYTVLAKCTKLEELYAEQTGLNTLSFVPSMPSLWRIDLKSPKVTDWAPLAKAKKLRTFAVEDGSFSDLKLLAGSADTLTNLTIIRGNVKHGDSLAKLTKLEGMNIRATKGIPVKAIKTLPALRSLYATKDLITDEVATELKSAKPNLSVSTYDR
jgi:hypothetical protein